MGLRSSFSRQPTSASRKRGKYQHYSAETRAKKYASENGNSKAINHFKEDLPTLKESTVRTFKQAYEKRLREEKRRPPILRDLDSKSVN